MRIGEAIRLDRRDLSPGEGLLTISDSKSGTSRQLPLRPAIEGLESDRCVDSEGLLARPKFQDAW